MLGYAERQSLPWSAPVSERLRKLIRPALALVLIALALEAQAKLSVPTR